MSEHKCDLFEGSEHVLPGWICGACRGYNGLQRTQCRACGHTYCGPKHEVIDTQTMTALDGTVHEGVPTKIRRLP